MNLKFDLALVLSANRPLGELVQILRKFKSSGGQQVDAINTLEGLRGESSNEMAEDVILELMDFVTGFCSPHMRIWD